MARALAKDPEDRYPSAGDLGRAALAAAREESVTESERSVAVGPAAPVVHTNGHVSPPTAITLADTPRTQVQEEETTVLPPRRRRRGLAGAVLAVAAVGGAVALLGLPGGSSGNGRARAPLSADEVRDVAQDFAQAYEAEDGQALGRLLTRDVQRVLPSGVARGRTRVVREYRSQFRAQDTQNYELDDLEVQAGQGRARERQLPRRAQGRRADRGPDRARHGPRPRRAADRADRGHAARLISRRGRRARGRWCRGGPACPGRATARRRRSGAARASRGSRRRARSRA